MPEHLRDGIYRYVVHGIRTGRFLQAVLQNDLFHGVAMAGDPLMRVQGNESDDQPISIFFEGDNGKPFKPSLSMRRVLVQVWGVDGDTYVGRKMTLYGDPEVKFGGIKVGGIRISHMSHIDRPVKLMLKGEGGIEREGRKWIDGLTWDMISPDCTTLTKVIAKTEASLPEPYIWDLAPLTDLTARLRQARTERAVGPVFISDRFGVPYTQYALSAAFRRCRKASGVNPAITLRDLRAGGVTEAKILGVPMSLRRDAAGHVQEGTTDRYSRARSESANTVISLRQKARIGNTG